MRISLDMIYMCVMLVLIVALPYIFTYNPFHLWHYIMLSGGYGGYFMLKAFTYAIKKYGYVKLDGKTYDVRLRV
jgi:hypothetical protein